MYMYKLKQDKNLHYIKITEQPLFKSMFPKGGQT